MSQAQEQQHNDNELKALLAELLPDILHYNAAGKYLRWKSGGGLGPVIPDAEMYYACYLARVEHLVYVMIRWNEPWQEQARHLLRFIEARGNV